VTAELKTGQVYGIARRPRRSPWRNNPDRFTDFGGRPKSFRRDAAVSAFAPAMPPYDEAS
jgi:hypothetical protein